jgi:hypothetical protein
MCKLLPLGSRELDLGSVPITPDSTSVSGQEGTPLKFRSQAVRNFRNFVEALLWIIGFGFIPVLILVGAFVYYSLILQAMDWPSDVVSLALSIGGCISALSAIIISIIATVRQMRGTTSKGFSTWIEDVAGLSLKQYGAIFLLFSR